MALSRNQLDKIGKRIRHGEITEEDKQEIENFRNNKIPELLKTLVKINSLIASNGVRGLISGRPKRLKSIIRKLERGQGTSLFRMVDIIGVRIIVENIEFQDRVLSLIESRLELLRPCLDYRDSVFYRAIHVHTKSDGGDVVEIQIRTLPQQLWAIESESFGEQVKEGVYDANERSYLSELSQQCKELDQDSLSTSSDTLYGKTRGPIDGIYPRIVSVFEENEDQGQSFGSYIVVFDRITNELLSRDYFPEIDLNEATNEYKRLTSSLSEDRFDILLLNAKNVGSLKVTHSNYFPIY